MTVSVRPEADLKTLGRVWIPSEYGTLVRALVLAALETSSQTILDLGNRSVAPKEVTRLCTVSFSQSAAVRSDA
ncbi:hypothetical protein EMIT0196MI5_230026 [Pseudomonas sp. IT-196MI5]